MCIYRRSGIRSLGGIGGRDSVLAVEVALHRVATRNASSLAPLRMRPRSRDCVDGARRNA